jgi:hypothetical protein
MGTALRTSSSGTGPGVKSVTGGARATVWISPAVRVPSPDWGTKQGSDRARGAAGSSAANAMAAATSSCCCRQLRLVQLGRSEIGRRVVPTAGDEDATVGH